MVAATGIRVGRQFQRVVESPLVFLVYDGPFGRRAAVQRPEKAVLFFVFHVRLP